MFRGLVGVKSSVVTRLGEVTCGATCMKAEGLTCLFKRGTLKRKGAQLTEGEELQSVSLGVLSLCSALHTNSLVNITRLQSVSSYIRFSIMSKAEFVRRVDKVNALLRTSKADLRDRDRLRTLRSSTIKAETRIRKQLSEASSELDSLLEELEVDKSTPAEIAKRQKTIKSLEVQLNACKRELATEQPIRSIEEMPDSELWSMQMQLRESKFHSEQDEEILALGETVHSLKEISEDMGDEVDTHLLLLNEMDKSVAKTQTQIEHTTAKLKQLVQKSSDSCLMCTIVGLMIVLFWLLVYV